MAFLTPEDQIKDINIPTGGIVVDFGAGSGAYTNAAAVAVGPGGKVYAVDINRELLTKVKRDAEKQGFNNVDVIWGDVERIGSTKIRDHIADLIILSNIIFQLDDVDGMMKELLRVLKIDGKVFVVDWTASYGGIGPAEGKVYGEEKARNLFSKHHFILEKPVPAGDYHYAFLASRTPETA